MGQFNLLKTVCIVSMFCAATAIASPAQTFTTLASFNITDGAGPQSSLIQATDGNFYGTAAYGGGNINCQAFSCGTVFKITPDGTLTKLHSFDNKDGGWPFAGLVQAKDGNFYGTTSVGGANYSYGTVFKITPAGTLTTLYSFCSQYNCFDGASPQAGLVQGQSTDTNLYGTTTFGGTSSNCSNPQTPGCGTVFMITPDGSLTTLHSFDSTDGTSPQASLVPGSDGNFYGTTRTGGAKGSGTVFKISPQSPYTLTTLHSFDYTDGTSPHSGLVQASDGNLYGTTGAGGANGRGTAFKIIPQPPYTLTTLHSFCSQQNCLDGGGPVAGLMQAKDGNLYGTTASGGAFGKGTIFRINPQSPYTLTTLYSFCSGFYCSYQPLAGLAQGKDSNFYGTAQYGGAYGGGVVFSLSLTGPNPGQLVTLTPCRLVDTRKQYGGGGPIQGGTFQTFTLPQLAKQGTNCPTLDLSSAAAYSLNVTVVPQVPLGYLTVWPTGKGQPGVSTLNSLDGRVKANAAIVPAGTNGAINVFASNTTDVVLDIDGYFAPPGSSTLAFYGLTPCRVVDTRGLDGALGGPHLMGQQARDLPVLDSSCFPQGLNPAAYSFNFTVVPWKGQPLGYLEVWPTGQMPANPVSTLNNLTVTDVANAAVVPAGSGGEITVLASNDTDLVVDVNGYFAAPGGSNALSLYTVGPCRVFDTRVVGNGKPFVNEIPVQVANSACEPPLTAQAYVLNATVVPPGPLGYLTLWADGGQLPIVSTLNAIDGAVTSNMAIVPTNNGSIDAFASNLTQLILDISSYFAP